MRGDVQIRIIADKERISEEEYRLIVSAVEELLIRMGLQVHRSRPYTARKMRRGVRVYIEARKPRK